MRYKFPISLHILLAYTDLKIFIIYFVLMFDKLTLLQLKMLFVGLTISSPKNSIYILHTLKKTDEIAFLMIFKL